MLPGVGPHHRIEHPQRRRLAGAVRSEQAGDRAVACVEADAVDRRDRAELLAELLDANHRVCARTRDPASRDGVGTRRRHEERRAPDRRHAARCRGSADVARSMKLLNQLLTARRGDDAVAGGRHGDVSRVASDVFATARPTSGGVTGSSVAGQHQRRHVGDDRLVVRRRRRRPSATSRTP